MEAAAKRKVLTVVQVNRLVAGMLSEYFSDIWVEGEVSNFRAYPSGHLYFALKDEESQIQAVCFKQNAMRLRFELEDGLSVIAHGRLEVYAPSGKYQIILDTIEPRGIGALQKTFEQLKRRLEKEGLFAAERKRPLPALVRVLGVVTSPAGAAIHDMLRTLRLHKAPVRVLLFPAQVQGEGAAAQIAEGVAVLAARPDVDAVIVGRGGGSTEDLWPFNEEVVARAIAASRVPVISGVGHETDFTIADFVADVRAATPTAAAQLVARGWEELEAGLAEQAGALLEAWQQSMLEREQRLDELTAHRAFELMAGRLAEAGFRVERLLSAAEASVMRGVAKARTQVGRLSEELEKLNPVRRILRRRVSLQELWARLGPTEERLLGACGRRLGDASARLDALSPLASLGRGYAICRNRDGATVTRVAQVKAGDDVNVRVSDGSFGATVSERTCGGK